METEAEIDAFMTHTSQETYLLLDTGHALFGGADPQALTKKYMRHIRHLHEKNARADVMEQVKAKGLSFLEGVRRGVFPVPGNTEGTVDFEPVFKIAAKHGYSGWLVNVAEPGPKNSQPTEVSILGIENAEGNGACGQVGQRIKILFDLLCALLSRAALE